MNEFLTRVRIDRDSAVFAITGAVVTLCLIFGVIFGVSALSLLAAGFGVAVALAGALIGMLNGYRDTQSAADTPAKPTIKSTPSSSSQRTEEDESVTDALETLRQRYARGELSDDVFERKLEALLETEVPETARNRARRTGDTNDPSAESTDLELESQY